ncbi:MAG: hypothetical protein V1906_02560 [Candidatus Woesearchaeota archaeon]
MDTFKKEIIKLLISYFGDDIGIKADKMYGNYEKIELLAMVKEMLFSMIGERKTLELLKPICKKYKVKL